MSDKNIILFILSFRSVAILDLLVAFKILITLNYGKKYVEIK